MLLREGDAIKLVKPLPGFDHVGKIFKITKLKTDGSITFEHPGMGVGFMSYNEFAMHFEKWEVSAEELDFIQERLELPVSKRKWSDWTTLKDVTHTFWIGSSSTDLVFNNLQYRHNGKRLTMRLSWGGVKFQVSTSCHPDDKFDVERGLQLALAKVIVKVAQHNADKMRSHIDFIQFIENKGERVYV